MNFDYLNNMIEYIEEHLTENIDYKNLAKIVGVSEYSLQRIFIFLTNISLSEYIRKRRLSKAFEELKTTNIKIIDLAIKYQYDSAISFARAFKNMFKITPSECKNNKIDYKQFPIVKFENNNNLCKTLNYEIKEFEETKIYCIETQAKTTDDLHFNIRKLYNEIKNNELYKKFNQTGMYGIFLHTDDLYYYCVGSKNNYKGTKEFILPKGKYAIFNVGSREQKDIIETENMIYNQWLPSTNYSIDKNWNFEFYLENNCYLYMRIKYKQN